MEPTGPEEQSISHFQVLEKIGQGGMGEVCLAQDTSLDRHVALKFLPESMQHDQTARKRFLREAKSAAALDHPYICHVHEVGEEEGRPFISMEYIQGTTLMERLKEGPLSLKEALQTATEVAEALEEAHKQGIVHRDLKPSNIMLTPQGHAKVMDFGLAKRLAAAEGLGSEEQTLSADLTRSGTMLGDPDQDYLADGMTEALITELGKIGALRVISRTSAMRYKGADKPLEEIARELNVDAVAEGSAQRVGQAAGINVRLTHVASERQLWSQAYQRDLGDLLRLQSEVAHAIATPRGWDGGTGGVRGNTTRLSN